MLDARDSIDPQFKASRVGQEIVTQVEPPDISFTFADNITGTPVEVCVGFDQFGGDAPTPEVLAIAAEEFQRLMLLLDDDRLRQNFHCKLEGYKYEEIGQRLGLACRSIERKLQRIRQIWATELEQRTIPAPRSHSEEALG